MRKVLIADDNLAIREMLRDILEDLFEIAEACDGEDALRKIEAERPALVLLDVRMPGLDGFEVLKRVRSNPDFAGTKVVALTAFAMQGDCERALGAGFDAYITKPVEVKLLRTHVGRLIAE
jgi:CheY-like chemotaxis protein